MNTPDYGFMTDEELEAAYDAVKADYAATNWKTVTKAECDALWARVHAIEAVKAARGTLKYATYNGD
jgi:hypothetical protein